MPAASAARRWAWPTALAPTPHSLCRPASLSTPARCLWPRERAFAPFLLAALSQSPPAATPLAPFMAMLTARARTRFFTFLLAWPGTPTLMRRRQLFSSMTHIQVSSAPWTWCRLPSRRLPAATLCLLQALVTLTASALRLHSIAHSALPLTASTRCTSPIPTTTPSAPWLLTLQP